MASNASMRILFVEDLPSDVELIERQLRVDGLAFRSLRVESERQFTKALDEFAPDLIISDFSLPQFDGMRALKIARERDEEMPFILVTGASNEETAVECMKAGATDYLIKGSIKRLGFAVREAIEQRDLRATRLETERALRKSEATVQLLAENVSDVLWMWDTVNSRCLYLSPSVKRLRGFTAEEAITQPLDQVLAPESYALAVTQMPARIAGFCGDPTGEHAYTDEYQQLRKDGGTVWTEVVTHYFRNDHADLCIIGTSRDITDRRKVQEELRLSKEQYEVAARAANDILFSRNFRTGATHFAPRFSEVLGYTPDQFPVTRAQVLEMIHPEDRERASAASDACVSGAAKRYESEHRLRCADGIYRWFRARGLLERNASGEPLRLTGSMSDIHERKVAEEQLLHDAFHDHLTGLPNRALFFDRLENAVRRTARDGECNCAVLMLDLDRFKDVNDSLGHLVGDQLLVKIGARIGSSIRQADTLARLGGDEFAILLDGHQEVSAALRVVDRIVKDLSSPVTIEGRAITIGVSIGIAFCAPHYTRAQDILRDADIALYRAKAVGRGGYEIFDPEMHEQATRAHDLEQDMRTVLERNELVLNYQAIVSLGTGRVVGFEALIRWQHPTRGLIPPIDFIGIAEETGLIAPIGLWTLREACHALARMDAVARFDPDVSAPPLTMNVNLSPRQVYDPGIVETFRSQVESCGIDAARIRLEITESVLMDRPEIAQQVLADFSTMGFTIHLDDFGTGYSSLKYLLEFPIHSIKIDRSFVTRIPNDARAMSLVETVLLLAAKLDLGVTAEGVETAEQLQTLREMGCEKVQGYFLSRPISERDATALVQAANRW